MIIRKDFNWDKIPLKLKVYLHFDMPLTIDESPKINPVIHQVSNFLDMYGNSILRDVILAHLYHWKAGQPSFGELCQELYNKLLEAWPKANLPAQPRMLYLELEYNNLVLIYP